MSSENLVIIPEENLTETCFPITFEQVLIPRTKENEARYRHLTVLILGVYVNEGHKIMVINKNPKTESDIRRKAFLKYVVIFPAVTASTVPYQKMNCKAGK